MFRIALAIPVFGLAGLSAAEPKPLAESVAFYASFDEEVKADFAKGQRTLDTRFNHATEKNQFVIEKGHDAKAFRIATGKGVAGGAFEAVDVLRRNGRVFFPAKGNLAYNPAGWSGSLSLWCRTDPDKLLKTKFCDPVQITQKGANNGGLWFDFNDAKPRDLRHGAFTMVPEGKKGAGEDDPDAPMVRVPKIGWKADDWHHVVLTWENLDTGKPNARTALYIDGKLLGEVKDRAIAMGWDIEKAGIYFSINYIGLLDEFAIFDRALTLDDVKKLNDNPGLLTGLKSK
jgi:hypothetical protein